MSTCTTEELTVKERVNVCVCHCGCLHLHVDDVTRTVCPFVCTLIFMHECIYMGDIVTSLSVCSDNRWVNGSFVIYYECVSVMLWTVCQLCNVIKGPQKCQILWV